MDYNSESNNVININDPIKIERRISQYDDIIHWHENIELLYFLDGRCSILNGDEEMEVNKGDLFVINSDYLHSVKCEINSAEYIFMIIDHSYCEAMGFPTSEVTFQKKLKNREIGELIVKIYEEKLNKKAYYKEGAKIYTLLILLNLFRNYISEADNHHKDSNKITITKNIIKYLKSNYNRRITITDVEAYCGYTKYYLSRIFKEIRGKTIMAQLNDIRVDEAKKHLINSQLDINTISTICGFDNQSYFGKVFKKIVGCSPIEFRKRKDFYYKK